MPVDVAVTQEGFDTCAVEAGRLGMEWDGQEGAKHDTTRMVPLQHNAAAQFGSRGRLAPASAVVAPTLESEDAGNKRFLLPGTTIERTTYDKNCFDHANAGVRAALASR